MKEMNQALKNNNTLNSYGIGYSKKVVKIFSQRSAARQAAFLVPYLKPTMKLLDCGCGPGSITIDFAHIIHQGEALGVDIEEFQLNIARELAEQRQCKNVSFLKSDISSLPFPDHTFDVAHVNGVLCQIKNPKTALAELKRVVKPGGFIAVREPDCATYLVYPDNPLILEAMSLAIKALISIGGDFAIGRKLKKIFSEENFAFIEASASCDTYGGTGMTIEDACTAMINDWKEAPWGKYVLEKNWASHERIDEFCQAFEALSHDPGAFINLTWYEVIAMNTLKS